MDYESIKALAKQMKHPVTELIALSPQNDPFYVGTERDRSLGAWFRDLWQDFGYTTGVHIRRMHYAIVSQNPPISFPNGKPYENTEGCWNELTNAAKAARYLEYVDPAAFVDRRNDDPVDHVEYWVSRRADLWLSYIDSSEDVALPSMPDVPHYELGTFSAPQRYHLEIWCEKSTMNDILEPIIRSYEATLLYGKGELSITAAMQAIERFQRSERPVRIFYVSDFDPAGACMPVSMARKLEYFVHKLGLDLDIKLFPIVLTYQQTKAYSRLLPTPIKESERRKASFEAKYGEGAIELDALEALYPGELRRVLEREMNRYYDHTLLRRLRTAQREFQDELSARQSDIHAQHEEEVQTIADEWLAIQEAFTQQIQQHHERRLALWHIMRQELEECQPELTENDIPEAEMAEERDGALFDSTRDYLTQNEIYRAHKAGESLS